MRTLRGAAIALWIVLGAGASTPTSSLTVVVFDYARRPRELVVSAAREARRVFRIAGVETEWIFCHPTEGCYVPEKFVQVKILARPVKSMTVSPQVMGSTITCGDTEYCAASYIFCDRVLAFADDNGSAADLTLGYVMAHEIGHLLGLGHRPGGVMTASFSSKDMRKAASGWLTFAHDDALELRHAVAQSQLVSDTARHIKLAGWRTDAAE
jgi:hypothetical protein